MQYTFDIYVDSDIDPSPEVIQKAVDEIYQNTINGDNGPVTPDRIGYILFRYENGKWTYEWNTVGRPKFERIRRITGYLTGTLDRFNDAKKHEESDRVKHKLEE